MTFLQSILVSTIHSCFCFLFLSRSPLSFSYLWYKDDNKFEIIKFLIEKGENVNAQNGDALTTACKSGNLPLVELLLNNGANAQNKFALDAARKNSNTKIMNYYKSMQIFQLNNTTGKLL